MKRQQNKRRTVVLQPKDKTQWHKGTLRPITNEKSIFIKPLKTLPKGYTNKDVYLNPGNISKYALPVKVGDSVEFVLGDRDKARPMARKIKISQYSPRTCQEMLEYITNLTENLESAECKKVLMETLSNTTMWSFLGSPVFENKAEEPTSVPYIRDLLDLLKFILRVGKPYKTLVEEMIKTVTQGTLFKASDENSIPAIIKSNIYSAERDKFYLRDVKLYCVSAERFRSFRRDVIHQVPSVARCLLPTVTEISEKIPNPSTQSFLCDILSLAFSGENNTISDEGIWQELPFIPTENELAGHLVEEDKHLSQVKNSYVDPESYMDTYFRLLRAETFSAIQHGIKDLKACELDERDMNVYHNIHLAGFEMQNGRFSLAVHFTSTRMVKNWKTSPQLMFGNLVCISLSRKFDDVIWAVVSNRDADILNKHQIIMLELIDENTKKMSEIVSSLQANAGSAVMVESPTYYHSLSPVLRSLKEFDMENFPLQQEVVHAQSTDDLPDYLKQAQTVNTRPIYKSHSRRLLRDWQSPNDITNGEMDFRRFLEVFNKHSSTCLEASQCEALKHALMNRLAIIQGPPGCGKTFIGAKIVQLLLSLTPKLEKPILLLTYKNHALDEFLKHMLGFCNKEDLVRIGSRSKEPELESCNLQTIMRTLRDRSYSKAMYAEIQETRDEIREVETEIKKLSSQVDASGHLTKKSLIAELNEEQLRSLLIDAPLAYKVNKQNFDKSKVQALISLIVQTFGSVKDFLVLPKDATKDHPHSAHFDLCATLFHRAFQAWTPDREEPRKMKAFQAGYVRRVRKETNDGDGQNDAESKKDGASTSGAENEDDQDSGDEEHVNELLERRMFFSSKQGEKSRDGLLLFTSFKTTNNNKNKKKNDNTTNNSTPTNNKDVLIDISDYPSDMQVDQQIRLEKKLWNLDSIERLQFLYCILKEKTSGSSEEFDQLIEKLEMLKKRKQELEMNRKVEMLLQKKIIGVTITGASINHDLLHHIGPSVVIVEEAAEILEPSLLAALTSSIEHLILIGDHKQLRPQVDTYELCIKFHFNKSMMERLIDSRFPFKTLGKQNRMRPEFSALLKDIYPNLQDNLELVLKNEPLKCIAKSMFFWYHEDPEKKDRTFTNVKEAERVIALVLYLLSHSCQPSEITVLAAYLGQTKLLRNLITQAKTQYPQLFQEKDDGNGEKEGRIQVQTIDMYQGDENQYVIISLVRSNTHGGIGFLKELNRRCVAQSRAKCGMYFVGNMNLLLNARNSCWSTMIHGMIQQECTGNAIPLRCDRHPTSTHDARDKDQVQSIVNNPRLLCKEKCGDLYPCGKHQCTRSCLPRHSHVTCVQIVVDIFPKCRHIVRRKCQQSISELDCKQEVRVVLERCGHEVIKECHQRNCDILCDEKVTATFPKCGHETEKKCNVKIEEISCALPCEEMNSCGIHACENECGKPHAHDSCPKMTYYRFPVCNHLAPTKKKCSAPINQKCIRNVPCIGPCGHQIEKKCSEKVVPPCTHQCEKMNSCSIHRCQNKCGKPHGHDNCPEMVDYSFPGCNHPSPKKKKCSEKITWKCKYSVYFKGACGHDIKKECCQQDGDVKCSVPCSKPRKCGHPCANVCGDDCEKGDCKRCLQVYEEKMKKFHEAAKKRVKELEDKISKDPVKTFSIDEISPTGSDSAEYQKVNDKVVKFVQPMHNWFPKVTKIEKVINLELEKKFEAAKSKAFGDHIDEKFHGTDDNGVRGITKDGFRMPDQSPPAAKRGMYGQGIYFATDSSKSAQKIYTKGSRKLLLCQVLLGKSKTVQKADPTLNSKKLKSERCDSVYAPRGTAVKNDEFVIFNPDQALPQYIIHFSDTNNLVPPSPKTLTTQSFFKKNMKASRAVNFQDPFEMYYNFAESHFRRMAAKTNLQPATISSIDIVINKDLERKFEATKKLFKVLGIPDQEILAYHGTDRANIDNILKTNLQLSYAKRQVHGKGNYFSEFPAVSLGYGDGGLLLCRILPGKEYIGHGDIPPGYNSKKVLNAQLGAAVANTNGRMVIIDNSDQILPFFVIHR